MGLQDSYQDRLFHLNVHMYDEFHVPDVLRVVFKQKLSYKLSMSDFPILYQATL